MVRQSSIHPDSPPASPGFSRRSLLKSASCGFGYLALTHLLAQQGLANSKSIGKNLHHAPKAKRVIFLFMHGGPSQVDTFDYKPQLQKDDGKTLPFQAAKNIDAKPKLLKSPWSFKRHGKSGLWVSELLPHTAKHIDDLCVIRSLHSRGQSHGQAVSMVHTGSDNLVRPSMGSWINYGLGSENNSLPAFVILGPSTGHGGPRNYGSAFLPPHTQATPIGANGKLGSGNIKNLSSSLSRRDQRDHLDLIQELNRNHLQRRGKDASIEGAIEAYELAYRMQGVAPEILDLSKEPEHIKNLYGLEDKTTQDFGRMCLQARRLAEAGVRFIELSTGNVWDQHGGLYKGHERNSKATDKPIAGLLQDLKERGMLDETLILWGGEFGRTPIVQGKDGRDHNPQGFTMWMAGGGVQGGLAYGETDEYGYYAVQDKVHMHDLHATILHLLGLDHERLTYHYAGRDFRLTDVYGRVVEDIIV